MIKEEQSLLGDKRVLVCVWVRLSKIAARFGHVRGSKQGTKVVAYFGKSSVIVLLAFLEPRDGV